METIKILDAGLVTTVQDLGRYGLYAKLYNIQYNKSEN